MVNITYIGHACFLLEHQGQRIVLDPYADSYVPGLAPVREEAEFVFCSHGHDDHSAASLIKLVPCDEPAFTLEEIVSDHDPEGGRLRGRSTIRVFDFHGTRVAHMGDVGRALREEEAERLTDLDAILIPVGGFYTIDAAQAAEMVSQLRPRVVIPMHYRTESSGYDVIAPVEEFTAMCSDVRSYGICFALDDSTPAQTALLRQKAIKE